MIRKPVFITSMLLAPIAQAGDYFEGYFYIVGSVPATISATEMVDFAAPEFHNTVAALQKEWSKKCEVPVSIWHTNLMDNKDTPWTPEFWFAYITVTDTEAEAYAAAPATGCTSESYVKFGSMVIPTPYQICAGGPEFYPDIYDDLCK